MEFTSGFFKVLRNFCNRFSEILVNLFIRLLKTISEGLFKKLLGKTPETLFENLFKELSSRERENAKRSFGKIMKY